MNTIPIAANLTVVPVERTEARRQLRQDCGWPEAAQVITFFSFLHPIKGIDPLVQGFKAVSDRHPQARLLLMGGVETLALGGEEAEKYWNKVQRQIQELELGDRVHCTGYIDAEQASRYLSGADIGVLPFNPGISLKSGSLLAMFAHRLPAIATCTHETDRFLTDKQVVAPVAPRSAAALTEAINALLDNPDEQQRLANSGHAFVQPFAWESITDRHQDIYQQLLTDDGHAARAHHGA